MIARMSAPHHSTVTPSRIREEWLPYGHQVIDETDIEAVVRVLRSEYLTTGPEVERFEEELARYVGARHAVAFTSATAALHAAVASCGMGPGDEGITTPLTFCATANCLLFQGARPVFADIDRATLTIDPEQIARRITARTKAIIPMDYGGHPAELDAIRTIARRRGLKVIEDACHALGAEYRGQRVGSLSDVTVFSFHPVKHITTGEGGMAVTNDAKFAQRLRRFRNHGVLRRAGDAQRRPWYYEVVELGYNYRIPDILCALGRSQLLRLEQNLARRREIAGRYTAAFSACPSIQLPTVRSEATPAWHLYPVRIVPTRRLRRDQVFRSLQQRRIGVQVHYIPVTLHPYYRKRFGYRPGQFPVAEQAYRELITLPLFHGMGDDDVEDVIVAVIDVMASARAPYSVGGGSRSRASQVNGKGR